MPEEVINAWVIWDTSITEYDNSVYSSNAMRIAMHLHNEIHGNWHDKRQSKVIDFMNQIKPRSIVEVGFGTPQRYVTEYVLKNHVRLSLLDFDAESLDFAKAFLDMKSNDWDMYITLREYNMNSGDAIGDFDLHLFQDSIEHANQPTEYFTSIVSAAKPQSHFILCLPIKICKAIPEHHIFWSSVGHALEWVMQGGLTVDTYHEIKMNPELDLFAEYLHPDFSELLVLGKKV